MMVPREAMASNGHRLHLIKDALPSQKRVACWLIPGAAWIVDVLGDFSGLK